MTTHISYDDHLAFLVRQEKKSDSPGDKAERIGFQDAKLFSLLRKYSDDRVLQNRYADGFFTGKEKIRFDEPVQKRMGNHEV